MKKLFFREKVMEAAAGPCEGVMIDRQKLTVAIVGIGHGAGATFIAMGLAFRLAERVLRGSELDILASNIALRFLCRAELVSGGYSVEQATEFIALSVNKKERAQRQAQRLFKIYAEVKEEGNGLL